MPDRLEQAPVIEPMTHFSVANSTASGVFHELCRWITSALYSPMIVSADALS
jgi:hypothetical protein